jgi:uncharacterized NAD(P)/FAD-binding protein YdhS
MVAAHLLRDTDDDGTLLDASGRASEWVYLVGPLRKGRLWENTAVPELPVEATALAALIATRFARAGTGAMRR